MKAMRYDYVTGTSSHPAEAGAEDPHSGVIVHFAEDGSYAFTRYEYRDMCARLLTMKIDTMFVQLWLNNTYNFVFNDTKVYNSSDDDDDDDDDDEN